jgi:hypothetical protein
MNYTVMMNFMKNILMRNIIKPIQEKLNEAVKQLRIASIYAQRVDWFFSGDDGEESFLERLSKELKNID